MSARKKPAVKPAIEPPTRESLERKLFSNTFDMIDDGPNLLALLLLDVRELRRTAEQPRCDVGDAPAAKAPTVRAFGLSPALTDGEREMLLRIASGQSTGEHNTQEYAEIALGAEAMRLMIVAEAARNRAAEDHPEDAKECDRIIHARDAERARAQEADKHAAAAKLEADHEEIQREKRDKQAVSIAEQLKALAASAARLADPIRPLAEMR